MDRRTLLLNAARTIVENDGPGALKARAVSTAAAVSTIAIYNEFGGMPELLDSLIRQSFAALDAQLSQVPITSDPVTDLLALGLAYRSYAGAHPHLYFLMFGSAALRPQVSMARDLTVTGRPTALPEPNAAFDHLIAAVGRAIDDGRIEQDTTTASIAGQIWSALHGFVMLDTVGFFGAESSGVPQILFPMITNVLIGLGDTRVAVNHSATKIVITQ